MKLYNAMYSDLRLFCSQRKWALSNLLLIGIVYAEASVIVYDSDPLLEGWPGLVLRKTHPRIMDHKPGQNPLTHNISSQRTSSGVLLDTVTIQLARAFLLTTASVSSLMGRSPYWCLFNFSLELCFNAVA
jgi:hypothetical protein